MSQKSTETVKSSIVKRTHVWCEIDGKVVVDRIGNTEEELAEDMEKAFGSITVETRSAKLHLTLQDE